MIGLTGVGQPQPTCGSQGSLGAVVVGSTGEAFAAVPWGTCGQPGSGPAGVQLYGIAPDGTVTTLEDVGVSQQIYEQFGSPPSFSFGVAGAANWFVQIFQNQSFIYYDTTSGLPNGLGVGFNGPNPSLGVTMDPAGDTFLIPGRDSPAGIQKFDAAGASVWGVSVSPQNHFSLGVPYDCNAESVPNCPGIVVPDELGGAIVPGYNNSAYDYGCGPITGPFLMRLDASGKCVWSKAAPPATQASPGGPFTGVFKLLPAGAGQVYVTGTYQGTFDYFGCPTLTSPSGTSSYLLELDSCGSCAWAKSFETAALGVTPFPDGDLLLSTTFTGTIHLGGSPLTSVGASDLALGRLSSAGAPVWSRSFGSAGATVKLTSAAADAMGGAAALVSVSGGSVNFGGGSVTGSALVKLENPGVFGWQQTGFSGYFGSDPCGAVITGTSCATCAPGGKPGFTVQKLAP